MRERASALAAARTASPSDHAGDALFSFHAGSVRYALPLGMIRAVGAMPRPTPVPGAPPQLLGLINQRGDLLPVFHLSVVMGDAVPAAVPPWVVVLGEGDDAVAVAATELGEPFVAAAPVAPGTHPLVTGVATDGVVLTMLLDGDALLRGSWLRLPRSGANGSSSEHREGV